MKKTIGKLAIVIGGYLAAAGAASVVVAMHVAATNTPDRNASSGMYAFGDLLFFLFALAFFSIPATGLALFFLRAERRFWKYSSGLAVFVALTGLGAMGAFFAGRTQTHGILAALAAASVLRILAAPALGVLHLLLAGFAPENKFRWAFGAALLLEIAGFAPVALFWAMGMARYR